MKEYYLINVFYMETQWLILLIRKYYNIKKFYKKCFTSGDMTKIL